MNWKQTVTTGLHIKYPIVQAPMLGVSTPQMAAAVSNEGGLGSLAVGGLSPEQTRQLITATKRLTAKPFAVNLFTHSIPVYEAHELDAMRKFILQLAAKKGYTLSAADLSHFNFYTYQKQVPVLLEENISIISFTFGVLDVASINLFKQKGCMLIGTATCVQEAMMLQNIGIDIVTVQGIEAGGHRGTFIDDIPLPQVGLFTLLPQVKQAVQIPCIAAGGISNAAGIQAAFALGADAVQMGTAFIGTDESQAIPSYKNKLATASDTSTSLTRAFSGRWARGIRNELMNEIEEAGIPIPPYPLQNSLTASLRKLAQAKDDNANINMWAGQAANSARLTSTREVFIDLVKAFEEL